MSHAPNQKCDEQGLRLAHGSPPTVGTHHRTHARHERRSRSSEGSRLRSTSPPLRAHRQHPACATLLPKAPCETPHRICSDQREGGATHAHLGSDRCRGGVNQAGSCPGLRYVDVDQSRRSGETCGNDFHEIASTAQQHPYSRFNEYGPAHGRANAGADHIATGTGVDGRGFARQVRRQPSAAGCVSAGSSARCSSARPGLKVSHDELAPPVLAARVHASFPGHRGETLRSEAGQGGPA